MTNPCYECEERNECDRPCAMLIEWVREGCPEVFNLKKKKKK